MTTEALLGLLNGVKRTTRGWSSRCPSHNDKSPSLSVREADDGRILLHCFAGCTTPEVCNALGIRLSDLFLESPANQLAPQRVHRWRLEKQATNHAVEKQQKASGGEVDLVREAARLVKSAVNIDISAWSIERLDAALNGTHGLADAYEILHRDGVLYESF